MKKPKVTLVNCTPDPEKTIYAAWQIMHTKPLIPSEIFIGKGDEHSNYEESNLESKPPEGRKTYMMIHQDMVEFLKGVANQAHGGVLEMVHFNFLIENVSRAFQQQLTRTRQASYCIQSLRVVPCDAFADDDNFLPLMNPEVEGESPERNYNYDMAMFEIQTAYRHLLRSGVSVEDARGILPLAIYSPIWMGINLRALIHMLDQRLCVRAQGEFREVVEQLREAVAEKHPLIAECFLQCGCERTKVCTNASPCGKYPKLGDSKKFRIEKDDQGHVRTFWE
jgi:thymidylate synthase (FAD)